MTPFVTYDERSGRWTLEREYSVYSRRYRLTVPGGFQFDLASIPRPLWVLVAPFELSIAAPLIHDWLYEHAGTIACTPACRTGVFSRAQADAFLLDIMRQEGVSWFRRSAAYCAVRAFGGLAWQASTRDSAR